MYFHHPKRFPSTRRSVALLSLVLLSTTTLAPAFVASAKPKQSASPQKTSELYQLTKIWNVHLKVTPEAWKEMEPTGGNFGPFGGGPPGGPGGGPPPPNGGPPGAGGPPPRFGGGPPGGPPGGGPPGGGFGPSMFIAPTFLSQGDQNKDGKLSTQEFRALADKWYSTIDKEKHNSVDAKQLRKGLNTALMPAGGPGGGPPMGLQAPAGKRNGVAGMMGIEFKYVHADMEFEGQSFKDVALRYKGNGTFLESRPTLKRSLKVELNHYVKGQKLAGISTINLHNNVTDASWMNEPLAHRTFREAGIPAPRTSYARVYVTVPGKFDHQYFGLYSVVENIDKNFSEEVFGTKKGVLFKPSTPNLFADLGNDWKSYIQTYDPKGDLSHEQEQRIMDLCKLVTSGTDTQFASKIGDFLDIEEFARYMAVLVWITDLDSILDTGQNFYLHLHPKTNKLQFIAWDQDHSFGQFGMMGSQEDRENLSITKPWMGEKRFLERIYKVEAFKKPYLVSLAKISKTVCQPDQYFKSVDELASVLRPAVREESDTKLARFDKAVKGEPLPFQGFGGPPPPPGGGNRPGGNNNGPSFAFPAMPPTQPIKPFVKKRLASVTAQLAGTSQGKTIRGMGFGPPGGGDGDMDFGPGMFMGPTFMTKLDANKDSKLTRIEFVEGFMKWFQAWNTSKTGLLTDKELRAGIDKTLSPFGDGPPPDFFGDFGG